MVLNDLIEDDREFKFIKQRLRLFKVDARSIEWYTSYVPIIHVKIHLVKAQSYILAIV